MRLYLSIVSRFRERGNTGDLRAWAFRTQWRASDIQALEREIRSAAECPKYQCAERISLRRSKLVEQDVPWPMDTIVFAMPPLLI